MPAELQELHLVWMQLRGDWSWLAVIPAGADHSTAQIAHSLSKVGTRLSGEPIDFIEAVDVDLDGAASLLRHLGTQVGSGSVWVQTSPRAGQSSWTRRTNRTLVSIDNPLVNPLSLPLALAADGVVLCVRRRHTQIASIRKSVDAVGADRILCYLVVD